MQRKSLILGLILGFSALLIIAGTTNFDALQTESTLTVGTSSAIGTSQTVGTFQTIGSYLTVGTDAKIGGDAWARSLNLGPGDTRVDSLGRVIMGIRNKSGASLAVGRIIELDTLFVAFNDAKILADSVWKDTAGIFDSEGGPGVFKLTVKGTPTNDSAIIWGTAMTGIGTYAAVADTLAFGTTANDIRFSNYLWTSFDSLRVDTTGGTGLDSLHVDYMSTLGAVVCATTSVRPFGVVINAAIADNAVGEICIFGACKVKCKSASGTFAPPGYPLVVGGGGTILPLAAANWGNYLDTVIVGHTLGGKDDVSDTSGIWMFFDPR